MDTSGNNNIELAVSEDSGILGDDERIKLSSSKTRHHENIITQSTLVELDGENITPNESIGTDSDDDENEYSGSKLRDSSFL